MKKFVCHPMVSSYILLFCGILLVISGVTLTVFAMFYLIRISNLSNETLTIYINILTPILNMTIGVFAIVAGCLAAASCCFRIKDRYTNFASSGCLVLSILLLLAWIIARQYYTHYDEDIINDEMQRLQQHAAGGSEAAKVEFDVLQKQWKCCGYNGPKDWEKLPSTCKSKKRGTFNEGCKTKVDRTVKSDERVLRIISIAIFLLLFGAIISTYLIRKYCTDEDTKRTVIPPIQPPQDDYGMPLMFRRSATESLDYLKRSAPAKERKSVRIVEDSQRELRRSRFGERDDELPEGVVVLRVKMSSVEGAEEELVYRDDGEAQSSHGLSLGKAKLAVVAKAYSKSVVEDIVDNLPIDDSVSSEKG